MMKTAGNKILIIDGYNVIHAEPHRFQKMTHLENRRAHFLKIIKSSPTLQYDKIIIVFDGKEVKLPGVNESEGKVVVRYSGANREADDVIQEYIREKSHHSELEIVSSDHKIRNAAKDHALTVISSQQFWQKVSPKSHKKQRTSEASSPTDRQLSNKEVQEWVKLFKNRSETDD
jgi:predicted RNA-binding protein with PIN domain